MSMFRWIKISMPRVPKKEDALSALYIKQVKMILIRYKWVHLLFLFENND